MDSATIRAVRDTMADYCQDKIGRDDAQRILTLAGVSSKGARDLLDAADANLTLRQSYKSDATS